MTLSAINGVSLSSLSAIDGVTRSGLSGINGQTTGSGTVITVNAGGDIQAAINSASCGDTIQLEAGATWDVPTILNLPNKGCGAAITITSTSSLPNRRVAPSDASLMPRLRATNANGIFRTATNAGYWILDGLNMTDNAAVGTSEINTLVDIALTNAGANHITVTRCLLYPKEVITDPTNYNRCLTRGVWHEGSYTTFTRNYAYGFTNRNGLGQATAGVVVLTISGNNLTMHDNFMDSAYASFFTGGGREEYEYTAALSGTISSTQADFSSTTGLVDDVTYVRFDLSGIGTLTGSSTPGYNDGTAGTFNYQVMTRTSGTVLVDFDGGSTATGFHIQLYDGITTYRARLKKVATNAYTIVYEYGAEAPAGAYIWTVSEVAKVTNIAGSTVTFSGIGPNALTQPPSGGTAFWRQNQVVHDITMTQNTLNIDIAAAEHEAPSNSPKGWMELKAGDNILIDGNYMTGYPSVIGITQHSDEGHTPWTKVSNLTISNNYVNSIYDSSGSRQFIILSQIDPYNSDEPGSNTTISNNLVLSCVYPIQLSGTDLTTMSHNTFINPYSSGTYGSRALQSEGGTAYSFTFTDNIVAYNTYGAQCFIDPYTLATCWPSGTWNHNVVVDNLGASVTTGTWGLSSILSPIKTAFSQVGFVNTATKDYQLDVSSDFKGAGTGGSDPGVDWAALVTALGFDPIGT